MWSCSWWIPCAPPLESLRGELEGRLVQDKVAQETQIWLAQARRRVTVDIKLAP